jgi:hypothetical protein
MPIALMCLVGFAMWAVVLVLAVGGARAFQVVTGAKKPNEFPSGQQHGGAAYWRLNRAHANTLENLPIFGAVVVVGFLTGVSDPMFSTLAQIVLGGRVVQSAIHIISGSVTAVNARFTAFLVQLACMSWMALLIVLR